MRPGTSALEMEGTQRSLLPESLGTRTMLRLTANRDMWSFQHFGPGRSSEI